MRLCMRECVCMRESVCMKRECVYERECVSCTHSGRIVLICARACACACSGWQRLIGCLKLQVNFCKKANKCRALSREMTNTDKASYASLPPCMRMSAVLTEWGSISQKSARC